MNKNTITLLVNDLENSPKLNYEYDKDFGIMISFDKKTQERVKNNKKLEEEILTNQYYLGKDRQEIKSFLGFLLKYMKKEYFKGMIDSKIFYDHEILIIGCACAGGIMEHNIIINEIDGEYFIKLNLNSIEDSVLIQGVESLAKIFSYFEPPFGD